MKRRFMGSKPKVTNYMKVVALEDELTVSFTKPLEYSFDEIVWQSLPAGEKTPAINKDRYVAFRANLRPNESSGIGTFSIDKQCDLKGNCMSLLLGDKFGDKNTLTANSYAFYKLFYNQSNIKSVDPGFLPATTIYQYCYKQMFSGCTSLTTAPELPATMAAQHCYDGMFQDCTSLTKAPTILPATTLDGYYCYTKMFQNCTSLTTAPILPATNVTSYCYEYMFSGCTSLTTAPELPATTLDDYCYNGMFNNCTSLTTAPELPATTLDVYCYYNMFGNCTSLIDAPVLPATTLAYFCYGGMFYNCSSLTTAPELHATTLNKYCCQGMFKGCTSLTTAPELPATTLDDYCYHEMFQDCTSLTTAPTILPATELTYGCYRRMFKNCYNLTTAPELPATELVSSCYNQMFYSCTSLTTAPELPATELVGGCYGEMFRYCTNLNYIKASFTTTPSSSYMGNWVYGVSSTGTFAKSKDATWYVIGYSGVPYGWIVQKDTSGYMKVVALEDNLTVSFTNPLEYSFDETTWQSLPANTGTPAINKDQYVAFRASLTPAAYSGIGTFSIDKQCDLKGNCMSLLFGGDFSDKKDLTEYDYVFNKLFYNQSTIKSVDLEFLPATTLDRYCYQQMFLGCTSLTSAPELPAATLGAYCYSGMFLGCTSLTAAPELPATTAIGYCYQSMFSGCTSLTTAPELPATTLGINCYEGMFNSCTSLTTAPELPATTLANYCYYGMFNGCTSLTKVPKLSATTLAEFCCRNMFIGCTSLTTAPELPATTLANSCYNGMFKNCSSLTTVPILPATTLDSKCYQQMFYGCDSLTVAPELPATTLASGCYNEMFSYCTNLTTAPELPATTLANGCYSKMFSDCRNLTTAPVLPATELVSNCYNKMFYYCKKLNYIKALFTTTPGESYTYNWVGFVSSTGTFVKSKDANWDVTGQNGVPTNWTVLKGDLDYMKVVALEDDLTVSFTNPLEYSFDRKTWQNLPAGEKTPAINKDQHVSFRAELKPVGYKGIGTFSIDKQCDLKGNCMSLLFGDNFVDKVDLTGYNFAFYLLFKDCSTIKSVDPGFLPATSLANSCYRDMFDYCTSLTTAPELPATTLADSCYKSMFDHCTSLTTAPELPATTLADSCYNGMFDNCRRLTTAPSVLPATSLADSCYNSMFLYCIRLTTAPELPATTLTDGCYTYMFTNCESLTTAPELPATTLADSCYYEMFYNCLNLTTAPSILPATTLASHCYNSMFRNCTSLIIAPELPATILTDNCYNRMFYNCSSLNYIKALFTTTPGASYTNEWVYGVPYTGTFIKSEDATWNAIGVNGVPNGWDVNPGEPIAYEFVDLGLPSGTKWSTRNLGASDVNDVGLYYQNGGEQGYKVVLEWYRGSYTIVSSEPDGFNFSTYNISEFKDAANIINKDMSIPSVEDWNELVDNGTFTYDGTNTVYTSNINGNTIIFPRNSVLSNGHSIEYFGLYCSLSFSIHGLNAFCVYDPDCMGAIAEDASTSMDIPIQSGMPIRPVTKVV